MSFPNMVRLSPGEQRRQTAKKYLALGTTGVTVDGCEFRYTRCGAAAIPVARLCRTALPMSDLESKTTGCLSTQITTYSTTAAFLRVSSTWPGASTDPGGATGDVTTGYIKNIFKDGYVYVASGSTGGPDNGGGQMLRIKESTTASTGTASQYVDLIFRDDERLHEAIDTGCRVVVRRNPYDRVIIDQGEADAGNTGLPLGVTPRDVTAHYYFWLQTKGVCPVHIDGATVIGDDVISSTNAKAVTTGAVQSSTGTGIGGRRRHIGTAIDSQADTLYGLIDLQL